MYGLKTFTVLFLLLIIPISSNPGFCSDDWFQRGLAHLRSQHFDDAVHAFSKTLETDKNRSDAYNNRAIAWFHKDEYNRAIEDFNKALEINPRCAEAYNNRGAVWFQLGQYDRAIDDYDKALGINPRFYKAYKNRGAAWFYKGNHRLALSDSNKALEINPNSADVSRQLAWIKSMDSDDVNRSPGTPPMPAQMEPQATPRATTDETPAPKDAERSQSKGRAKSVGDVATLSKGRKGPITVSNQAYAVQVGAFAVRENAERLSANLRDKGYDAKVLSLKSWSNQIQHTVRIGNYKTREEAINAAAGFSEKENMHTIVRPSDAL